MFLKETVKSNHDPSSVSSRIEYCKRPAKNGRQADRGNWHRGHSMTAMGGMFATEGHPENLLGFPFME